MSLNSIQFPSWIVDIHQVRVLGIASCEPLQEPSCLFIGNRLDFEVAGGSN